MSQKPTSASAARKQKRENERVLDEELGDDFFSSIFKGEKVGGKDYFTSMKESMDPDDKMSKASFFQTLLDTFGAVAGDKVAVRMPDTVNEDGSVTEGKLIHANEDLDDDEFHFSSRQERMNNIRNMADKIFSKPDREALYEKVIEGSQKMLKIDPEKDNDFPFSVFGEELEPVLDDLKKKLLPDAGSNREFVQALFDFFSVLTEDVKQIEVVEGPEPRGQRKCVLMKDGVNIIILPPGKRLDNLRRFTHASFGVWGPSSMLNKVFEGDVHFLNDGRQLVKAKNREQKIEAVSKMVGLLSMFRSYYDPKFREHCLKSEIPLDEEVLPVLMRMVI